MHELYVLLRVCAGVRRARAAAGAVPGAPGGAGPACPGPGRQRAARVRGAGGAGAAGGGGGAEQAAGVGAARWTALASVRRKAHSALWQCAGRAALCGARGSCAGNGPRTTIATCAPCTLLVRISPTNCFLNAPWAAAATHAHAMRTTHAPLAAFGMARVGRNARRRCLISPLKLLPRRARPSAAWQKTTTVVRVGRGARAARVRSTRRPSQREGCDSSTPSLHAAPSPLRISSTLACTPAAPMPSTPHT